jgi:hypothetical protein
VGDEAVFASLRPGDAVVVDNTGFLAAQTYHRHQVPSPDFTVWDQFRNPDGSPLYPQRPLILGPLFAAAAAGTVQTGAFEGKMIVVACLLDREALPWQADWYRRRVHAHLGASTDDNFRLWFIDNALHGDDEAQESPTHTVSYLGALHQALRDLSTWVEKGVVPPATTVYEIEDGQVVASADATKRGGIQPLVTATADGTARADVAVGQPVALRATASAPCGVGEIVAVDWDLDGAGSFPVEEPITIGAEVTVERHHTFTRPGTYFPTVRVVAHRDGDAATAYARQQNLARVRVVVT